LTSDFELRQLEAEAAAVRAQLPPLERERDTEEAALAVLLGRSPRAIFEGAVARAPASAEPIATGPAGRHAVELLLRRPDLVEAEQRLVAANARIAAARAAMFPSIVLTGFLGSESAALAGLFSGPAGIWTLACCAHPADLRRRPPRGGDRGRRSARAPGAGAVPARDPDRVPRGARRARRTGARPRNLRGRVAARDALSETLRLARLRYEHGLSGQLDVLDSERGLLAAQMVRIDALRAQRAAIADLYKALGG
jgi:multidrug efflux system outer membrane protein